MYIDIYQNAKTYIDTDLTFNRYSFRRFFQEVALLEQPFVVDEKGASIKATLEAAGKELGAPVEVVGFVRYAVGETASA